MDENSPLDPKIFSTKMKSQGYMVLAQPMPAGHESINTAKTDECLFLISGHVEISMGVETRTLSVGETVAIRHGSAYRIKVCPPNGAFYLLAKKPC